ncbi:MAG: hypothetical protein ACPGSD_07865 [Flavobacteriales bacterium]
MTISKDQIRQIHVLLAKRDLMDVKKDILQRKFNIESTKQLTFKQANVLIVTLGGDPYVNYTHVNYGKFDFNNNQHRRILSICNQLGWTKINPKTNRVIADIEHLGAFIQESGYRKKPLLQYTPDETSKLIHQLENVLKHKCD